ncbi:hypothetical protein A0H81_10429 [Grifola frondosa]|uniref:Uncharacterized protein n=1 Tax=Grifola frondosa TaxID=5627 RepID=A0A1C7LYF1_GRIFR|nr:hypothetical protein A0H81_10429 [Grifola frondosa]
MVGTNKRLWMAGVIASPRSRPDSTVGGGCHQDLIVGAVMENTRQLVDLGIKELNEISYLPTTYPYPTFHPPTSPRPVATHFHNLSWPL